MKTIKHDNHVISITKNKSNSIHVRQSGTDFYFEVNDIDCNENASIWLDEKEVQMLIESIYNRIKPIENNAFKDVFPDDFQDKQEIAVHFIDKLHGIKVMALSRTSAWAKIRIMCHENGLKVPTIDQVERFGELKYKPITE